MKQIWVAILFCLFSETTLAQGQADNWYFGINAGVTFNSGTPVGLTNGALSTSEGSATISDENGNLLFYSDGRFAYNRNHQQMPNGFGLLGNPSSAQSAIIVPKPGDETRYFIFTVPANGGADGFRYSEVDMTLDGGLGDIIVGTKNTLLFTPTVEKVAAVGHANGLYYWVIAHGLNNNRYYAYLVDCNGVGSPVISDVGQVEGVPGWGCLTASPDGTMLATAMRVPGFELLDFDNATGVVSNPLLLHVQQGAYGVSFSPNSQVLYALSIEVGEIFQWDLQAGTPANIVNSRQVIGIAAPIGSTGYQGGTIQQGPDGKLYIPDRGQPNLSVINNPNTVGPGCNLQHDAVDLLGRSAILGLPPFIASFFDTTQVIGFSPVCQGSETVFEILTETTFLDSVRWTFGEPTSGPANTSDLINPGHTYANAGTYQVQLVRYIDCVADTDYVDVTIEPYPVFNQTAEICSDETYTLPGGDVVSLQGTYFDTIPDGLGCDSVVITDLTVNPVPALIMIPDTAICTGETIALNTSGADSYSWSPATDLNDPNVASPVFSGTTTSSYTLVATSNVGCDTTASVTITVNPLPTVDAGTDDAICNQQTAQLNASGAQDYSWSPTTGLDDPTIANPVFSGSNTTTFTVTGTDANGCSNTDDVEVTVYPLPVADFDPPADVCLGYPTEIVDNSTGTGLVYNWTFGDGSPASADPEPTHTYQSDGSFDIDLTLIDANGCQATASATATVLPLPEPAMNITDGEEFCEFEEIQFENQTPGNFANVLWDFGDNAFVPGLPNTQSTLDNPTFFYDNFAFSPYTVTLIISDNNGCSEIAQSVIIINDKPQADFSASIVCEGMTTELTDESTVQGSTVNQWEWDMGDNSGTSAQQNPSYQYQQTGIYTAELIVTTDAGCKDTVSGDVIVNPVPQVSIAGIDTCLNDQTDFSNSTIPQDNTIVGWDWDFGDGNSGNGITTAHTYQDFGVFTVELTATSDSGCVSSGTTQVEVFPNPEPDFALQTAEGCTPHEVLFIDQTTIANGSLDRYFWDLDDTTSTSPNPVHVYADSGYYDITLSVTSSEGCNTEIVVENAVRANITPVADFDILKEKVSLLDARLEMTESSLHAINYYWNLGDGTTSNEVLPEHTYAEPGVYDVVLVVENGDCQDAEFGQIVVDPIYTFYIPSAFTPDDDGINETFFGTGESIQTYNMRIYDRWGEMLFESNEPEYHWDGTYKGRPVEAGLYVYEFYILDIYERDHVYSGHFNLLR